LHWLLVWLMIFATGEDPRPAAPALGLSVDGSALPTGRMAFTVMPGDSVTLTAAGGGPLRWTATAGSPSSADAAAFGWRAPRSHGIFFIDAATDTLVERYTVIVPVEASRWRTTTLNSVPIGSYGDGSSRDRNPDCFVELTASTLSSRVSTTLTVGDFLGHVEGAFPQYMVLDLRLADKLERILEAVRLIYPEAAIVRNISGFRTPAYNAAIGNDTSESLHLYGKAADIWIESWPPNDLMDDIDRNKRVDVYDGEFLVELVRVLEARGDVVTGGASAYRWNQAHGPFVHVDVRGSMATWPTSRTLVSDPVV
jgi:hypothetical protein